jgi:hypothetical protein
MSVPGLAGLLKHYFIITGLSGGHSYLIGKAEQKNNIFR